MNDDIWTIAASAVAAVVLLVAGLLVKRRIPKKLKEYKFLAKWRELQRFCKDKTTWPKAITEADKLLNEALKKRRFKGKSMGERLASAQRSINNNDEVWFAHNLYKKITDQPDIKLKETDVKKALFGFREALKDLGALPDNEKQESRTRNQE